MAKVTKKKQPIVQKIIHLTVLRQVQSVVWSGMTKIH